MKEEIKLVLKQHKINSISANCDNIKAGEAFFAIKGTRFDGNDYIDQAISKGAKIAFTSRKELADNHKIFYIADTRLGFAQAAETLYPNIPEHIVAVTGTNGKSSVVSYIRQLLNLLGKKAASIGTLGIDVDGKRYDNDGLTTSDPLELRKNLQELYQAGINYVALEASSHGLDQKRLGELKFQSAGFVSFSQDHLDYHANMDSYLQAKLLLFTEHLAANARAVINSEIQNHGEIMKALSHHKLQYQQVGFKAEDDGDIQIINLQQTINGQEVRYEWGGQEFVFSTNIVGSFQAYNILIAAALVGNLGFERAEIAACLHKLQAVDGRMQRVPTKLPCHIFIDYAHTPDALQSSLQELAKLRRGDAKLYVVFGCGGDRDKLKRRPMGEVAAQIADHVIITDDNPRYEAAEQIRNEIMQGAKKGVIIADRKVAIIKAIESLKKDDILLIAGKGHEDYQIIEGTKYPFSDLEVAKLAINTKNEDSVE